MAVARYIWVALGALALALGAIGVLLPGLPTTPFVLLAAFCFGKGAPHLAAKLHDHHLFGPILSDWQAHGAIAVKYKVLALVMMAATLGLSLWLALPAWALSLQALCMAGAATFILTRPSGGAR